MADEPKGTLGENRPPARSLSPSVPPPPLASTLPEACALGVICALVGSVPSALRATREGGSWLGGWVASAAVVLPLIVAFIALGQSAGRGYRMLTGNSAGRSTAAGLALWVGLSVPLFTLLGAALKAGTNHRGIGGATFGVLATAVVGATAIAAYRIVRIARSFAQRWLGPGWVAAAFAHVTLGPSFAVALLLGRGSEQDPAGRAVVATLIDGAIFVVACALAASSDFRDETRARLRTFGPWIAATLFGVGFAWVMTSSTLGGALRASGGLAATLIGGLRP